MQVGNKNPDTGSQFPEADLKARCLSLLVADLIRDRVGFYEDKLEMGWTGSIMTRAFDKVGRSCFLHSTWTKGKLTV